ncbi:MAG: hypothetical protein GY884_18895 [Proteobacteria bacterium]|nr:hypothetical protein [Pseudomonadota bacterium]
MALLVWYGGGAHWWATPGNWLSVSRVNALAVRCSNSSAIFWKVWAMTTASGPPALIWAARAGADRGSTTASVRAWRKVASC